MIIKVQKGSEIKEIFSTDQSFYLQNGWSLVSKNKEPEKKEKPVETCSTEPEEESRSYSRKRRHSFGD